MNWSRSFFIKSAFAFLSIIGYGLFVFAAAPTGGYIPGQTNDPACAPGDTDCVVNLYVTTATDHTWIGTDAGQNSGSTDNTVFIGIGAGDGATSANYSNFIGTGAGLSATNANNANMFGQLAGCYATNANNANMFGQESGCYATNANNSNFFGYRAGYQATNADNAVFFGDEAGNGASSAYSSAFIGASAGYQATNAYQANFLGREAGYQATNASDSSFLGYQAGYQATDANGSFFAGNQAGYMAYGGSSSLMIGNQAGYNETGTLDFLTANTNPLGFSGSATFLGYQAGYGAEGAVQGTFLGTQAGYKANGAILSTFIGFQAGYQDNYVTPGNNLFTDNGPVASTFVGLFAGKNATHAFDAIFVGNLTGEDATHANSSVFVGPAAGRQAFNASNSVFLGIDSGDGADNAAASIFIGRDAGSSAINAPNSIFIGSGAGSDGQSNNSLATVTYSNLQNEDFILGDLVQGQLSNAVGTIVTDSGSVLQLMSVQGAFIPGETIISVPTDNNAEAEVTGYTIGSYSILIGDTATTGGHQNSIALGTLAKNTLSNQFMIGSTEFPIDEVQIRQTGGTNCTITGPGLSCTSDEKLKTNITDLSQSILDEVTKVRTVTYNWKAQPNGKQMIGFLAQDLEQYFPELVSTNESGQKSVNYANMTPVLVEAIRELNIKMSAIESTAQTLNETMASGLRTWFADAANGIGDLFARVIHSDRVETKQLCVGSRCISEAEFNQLLDQQQVSVTPVLENTNEESSDSSGNATTSPEVSGEASGDTPDTIVTDPVADEGEPVNEPTTEVVTPETSSEETQPSPEI